METPATARMSILVVDDTPDNLSLIHGLLRDSYKVRVATNATKAMQILEQGDLPDLALLDVMMPGQDGYELCSRMKADPRLRDIPVIFISARSEIADEQKAFASGGVDYVTKPISPATLLARIETHLRLRKHPVCSFATAPGDIGALLSVLDAFADRAGSGGNGVVDLAAAFRAVREEILRGLAEDPDLAKVP
jgi:CheY-like chemotaxis protein